MSYSATMSFRQRHKTRRWVSNVAKKWAKAISPEEKRITKAIIEAYQASEKRRMEALVAEVEKYTLSLLEETVRSWKGGGADGTGKYTYPRPDFLVEVKYKKNSVEAVFYTDSYLWNLLDQGTEGMILRPKKSKVFAFYPRVVNRTTPGTTHVRDQAQFGEMIFTDQVRGFTGRKWTETIARKVQDKFSGQGVTVKVSKL